MSADVSFHDALYKKAYSRGFRVSHALLELWLGQSSRQEVLL
jgi:hypothetical protein